MKVLVTGAHGQLAIALSKRPVREHEIICLGRPELDITLADTVTAAFDRHTPDIVINTAAYTNVERAESEPELAARLNQEGAGNVARSARRYGCPIIHISTDYVFDGRSRQDYLESDATAPLSVYGASKLAGEAAVESETPDHVIVRTSWLHSPYGTNFVKTMLRLAGERAQIDVVDDQFGCPTSAVALARALMTIAEQIATAPEQSGRGVYHLAGNGSASWAGFAREVFKASNAMGGPTADVISIDTASRPTAAERPARSVLNCDKAETAFGVRLPDWRISLTKDVRELMSAETAG